MMIRYPEMVKISDDILGQNNEDDASESHEDDR